VSPKRSFSQRAKVAETDHGNNLNPNNSNGNGNGNGGATESFLIAKIHSMYTKASQSERERENEEKELKLLFP
jgi:hypothetical protein